MATKLIGIDVSEHNGVIDWAKVKKAGAVDFAIIRAGYGNSTSQKDRQFSTNLKNAQAQGIPCGAYWFSYATTIADAKAEAKAFISVIGNNKFEYPLYFDWEGDSMQYAQRLGFSPTKTDISNFAIAFCSALEDAGYYAGVYMNLDYYKNYFTSNVLKKYDLWYAQYGSYASVEANLWQYSSTGTVSGISGNVDMNVCSVDYPSIIKNASLNGYKATSEVEQYRAATQSRFGFTDGTMKYLDGHSNPLALYKKLATKG